MAIPTELGVNFSRAEIDSMEAAINTVIRIIRSKQALNLTNAEKNSLHIISNNRFPYVQKAVEDYGVAYPKLNGLAHPHGKAAANWQTYNKLFEVLTSMTAATELATEMQMVAGHFCFKFMKDQYANAKRYRNDNVKGAQVVYDGLKGCFEGQGPQGDPDTYELLY